MRASWQAGDSTAALTSHTDATSETSRPVINFGVHTSLESQPLQHPAAQIINQRAVEGSAGQASVRCSQAAADMATAAAVADVVSSGYATTESRIYPLSVCCHELPH